MNNLRIIPRLDIKAPNLIKGIQLEGLRVIGDPQLHALLYYQLGADELIYMDIVASLYGRNNLGDIIKKTVRDVFIPITVGGGIRSLDDVKEIMRCGADKVAINTAAVANPNLIENVSNRFGSQAMVLSIEAKKKNDGNWEVYTDNGREPTGLDVIEWASKAVDLGAGEILVTAVDKEGTRQGFDIELAKAVCDCVSVPIIMSGGMGTLEHFTSLAKEADISGIAMADVLHYKRLNLTDIRTHALDVGLSVRLL
jgi:cyclase